MRKRIDVNEKIKVFISSICGEEKYDKVRAKLKSLIEDTGIAKVYLFEGNKIASTLTAEQDYLYELDDSDVCIFLIDNADGVHPGVLREYQRAKSHPKKAFYLFCDENKKEPTYIQKELTGAKGAKYYVVNSFKEFIEIGYHSLINDICRIYISYCKGRLIDPEFSTSTGNIVEISSVVSESFDKQIFKNIDMTKNIITNEIFSKSGRKVENTCSLDNYSTDFLKVLFGQKSIKEFNTYFLLSELENLQSENLHKVVKERWMAIQHYWMNDLGKAINHEKEALKLARELHLPNWLIQDILIDLRNIYNIEAQKNNQYLLINNLAQKELDNEKTALFYPLLDRYDNSLYGEIMKQLEKFSTKSPYTTILGSSIDLYGDYISNIYVIAIFNGSLTHLIRTINRLKDVAFILCDQYSDWEFRILLLKTALYIGDKKEIEGLIDLFNDVYGKMNSNDSKEIYEFCKSNPIKYKKSVAQLLAFQYLGYYFSDDYYSQVWNEIIQIFNEWIDSEDRVTVLGDYIFDAIKDNLLRLDNNLVVKDILMKVFDNKLIRFYDKVLGVIYSIDLDMLSEENLKSIVNQIQILIKNKTIRENCHNLKKVIIEVRKQNLEFAEELDNVVMKNMPEFYKDIYLLETETMSQLESEEYISKFIAEIKKRNETQGKNGKYTGYMDNPYKTIENIIKFNNVKVGKELVESIMFICKETLYEEKQTLSAKVEAVNLIIFLRLISSDELFDFKQFINQIKEDENIIICGQEMIFIDKTTKSTLQFDFMMMKLVFNSIGLDEIVELFSSYNELETFEKLEALKTIVSMLEHGVADKVDEKIMLLILQFTLGLSYDKNHNVRYFAIKALLYIINEENKVPIIKRIVEIADYDSVYIKNLIMNFSDKLKKIDSEAYNFIIEKALVDNHYVIRKRASNIAN